jgi:hypothetical protein
MAIMTQAEADAKQEAEERKTAFSTPIDALDGQAAETEEDTTTDV